jgi:hypothetical protein
MLGGTQTQKGWEPLPALTYLDFLRILIISKNVSFSVQLSFGEEGNIRPGEQASSGEKTLIVCWLCRLLILKLRYI